MRERELQNLQEKKMGENPVGIVSRARLELTTAASTMMSTMMSPKIGKVYYIAVKSLFLVPK
jgi:hypothetical protein